MRKKKRTEAALLQARLEREMMAALLAPAKVSVIFRGSRNQHLLQTHIAWRLLPPHIVYTAKFH